jgi:hypothetical protein
MGLVNGWYFKMSRYIIFSGCSFTWGQGLWVYSPTKLKVPNVVEYIDLGHPIPFEADDFRINNRFANLVANHFGCWEIVKRQNGGTDEESLRFLHEVKNNKVTRHSLLTENVEWEGVKYIVFQTTQAYRSPFVFFYKGNEYELYSEPGLQNLERVQKINRNSENNIIDIEELPNIDIFLDWLIDNNLSVENFEKIHLDYMSTQIKNTLKYFEDEYNIKTLIVSWTDEYIDNFLNDTFTNDRLVRLNYKGNEFVSIEKAMKAYPNLEIINDTEKVHDSGADGHPSLECHRMIADSLISKIGQIK